MKNVKFKVWDGVRMRQDDSFRIGYDGTVYELVSLGVGNVKYRLNEKMVPLQWTGLLDKNGKEIYAGDIVETPHKLMGKYKWQVISQNGAFVLTDRIGVRRLDSDRWTKQYKVIGSVYENPEFLQKTP